MSTNVISKKDIKRGWHLVDAKDQILGRIATDIATKLLGKNKSQYVSYLDTGDYVVVINASFIKLSGKKTDQKKYVSHSGFPGGLKEESFVSLLKRSPDKVIRHAVSGMLPKTRLGKQMIKKLHVFADDKHSYEKQFQNKYGR